jgi:hypothetical protein
MSEGNLAASRHARHAMAEARRARQRAGEERRHVAEARETAMRAALARRPRSVVLAIEHMLRRETDPTGSLRELLATIAKRAPRLVDEDMLPAIGLLARANRVRTIAGWKPSGKSCERLFRSLAEHLLALYPMPPFLWSAFFAAEDAEVLARVAAHVASGGSLYQAVKSGLMPVPLTRGMCHQLLCCGGGSGFLDAVRRVQVRSAGGDARLHRAWVATRAGRRLHPRGDEEFWQTVIAWLATNPMLPHADVGPLVDYIEHRRVQSPGFSLKGRSVPAMVRAMHEWHGDLAEGEAEKEDEKTSPTGELPSSSFEPMAIDWSREGSTEIWHICEILDRKSLAEEGRAMRHCVLSYLHRIRHRECSIWVLTLEDDAGHWRRLTIEVRPAQRWIVQARGPCNRPPEPRERMALETWASHNRLVVCL